jgi:hypothetical protein
MTGSLALLSIRLEFQELSPMNESDSIYTPKPRLVAVEVPWRVSPSTSFLKPLIGEVPSHCPTEVTFLGYDPTEYYNQQLAPWQVDPSIQPSDEELIAFANAHPDPRDKVVKVTFEGSTCVRMYRTDAEFFSERFPSSLYDWSEIKFYFDAEVESEDAWEEQLRLENEYWQRTGICPDPSMYAVQYSPWLEELQLRASNHYLIIGYECYVEVIAAGWSWRFLSRDEVTAPSLS